MSHTPEPWKVAGEHPEHIMDKNGYAIADMCDWGSITNSSERQSNAARIVSCVNACAIMSDPVAEVAALRKFADKVASVMWYADADISKIDDAIEELNEAIDAARNATK